VSSTTAVQATRARLFEIIQTVTTPINKARI
jgi:hypothetical protein